MKAKARKLQSQARYTEAIKIYEDILKRFPELTKKERKQIKKDLKFCREMIVIEKRDRLRSTLTRLKKTAAALRKYHREKGGYPSRLSALVPDYIEKLPKDAWGKKLSYQRKNSRSYRLHSLGADGKPGGKKENFDLIVKTGELAKEPKWLR